MPNITIEIYEGRTVEQKRLLAREVTDAVVRAIGSKPEKVRIRIVDMKKHDVAWAGNLTCDQD